MATRINFPELPTVPGQPGDTIAAYRDGQVVRIAVPSAGGGGTVTSVAVSVPTGFAVANSPVTSSGTIQITFDTGYGLPTTVAMGQWATSYGWGNHASAGYASASAVTSALSGKFDTPTGTAAQYLRGDGSTATFPSIPAGTVTSVAVSVPTGLAAAGSPVTSSGTLAISYASGYAIPTTAKQGQWDTAYGWGNHASAGYALSSALPGKLDATQKGAANGVAPLDADAKVPALYLPSFVDDVLEYASFAALPATGETGKIYVTLDTNRTYRWGGSSYTEISPSPGSTDAVPEGAVNHYFTAARVRAVLLSGLSLATNAAITASDTVLSAFGKLQKQITDLLGAYNAHAANSSNPHGVTKAQVGLPNVDNTADADKPISTATQNALNGTVKTSGDQTIAGTKTFSTNVRISGGDTQYVAGTGGWARGIVIQSSADNRIAGMGILGSADTPTKGFIGFGTSPWTNSSVDFYPTYTDVKTSLRVDGSEVWRASNFDPATKVDKVTGKGLSTEDFSTAEKSKLSGIANNATANTGTVTSVGVSAPTGLSVASSPVTSSGTIAISYAAGYAIPTTAKQSNWDTAYGWGNHASAGYATASALTSGLAGKVDTSDVRLTNAREWSASTVTQATAEAGTNTSRFAWTSQRVRQAIAAYSYNKDEVDALISASASGAWIWQATTSALLVQTPNKVDFSSPRTLTLPASPTENDYVMILKTAGDSTGSTIARNGQTIMGAAENMSIDSNINYLRLDFVNSSWRIAS